MTFDTQTTVHFTPEEEQVLQKAETIINELYETIEEDEVLELGNAVYNDEELENISHFLVKLNTHQAYFARQTEK